MCSARRHLGLALALLVGLVLVHHAADAAQSATRAATIKAKWEDPAYRANVYKGRFGGNSTQAKRARAENQWADPMKAAEMIIARHGAAAPSLDRVYAAVKARYGGNSTEARSLRAKMQHARRQGGPAPVVTTATPVAPSETPPAPMVAPAAPVAAVVAPAAPVVAPAAPVVAPAARVVAPQRSRFAAWALRGRLAPLATHVLISREVKTALDEATDLSWANRFDEALAKLPSGEGLTARESLAVDRLRHEIHRARDVRVGAPVE